MDKVGTQGADVSKKDMFKLALETVLNDMIGSVLNKYAVGRLMEMNRVDPKIRPTIVPGSLDSPDLEKMGSFIESMATAGILSPNRKLEDKLLTDARLPTPPDEDESIFADSTMPTPRDSADQAAGVLSQSQIDTIVSINRAIKTREMTLNVAVEIAAASLGMDVTAVKRFLIPEPEVEPAEVPLGADSASAAANEPDDDSQPNEPPVSA